MEKHIAHNKHHKNRGKFLTIVLVCDSILILALIGLILFEATNPEYVGKQLNVPGVPYIIWQALSTLLMGISLIGIWLWKRKAVYASVLLWVITLIVTYSLTPIKWTYPAILVDLFNILYFLIWVWAIKRKWQLFT